MIARPLTRVARGAAAAGIVDRAVSDADAASFQSARPRLFGIAYRMLRTASEAEDVVQDTWIRWQRADRSEVRDAAAFLAATTTRLAINVAQSARARRETHAGPWLLDPVDADADPALGAERRDALEVAVHLLLEKLSPTERAAYVLREAFDYPYRDIAQVLGLNEANARQLVTRARRRLAGDHRRPVGTDERERLLDTFVAAAQTGDLATLEHLLARDVDAGGGRVVPATRLPVRRDVSVPVAA
jgi:RNA polymerase sigma-70 factor (ECF subfamily)